MCITIGMDESRDAEILSKIEERVTTEGHCKIWGGAMRDGLPRLGDIYIRRFLWNLTHDEIDRKHIIKTTCTTQNCVNKDHLTVVPLTTPPDWDEVWGRMVKKTKKLETEEWGTCLIWTASKRGRYGCTKVKGKNMSAHRASYLVKTKGAEIPTEINGKVVQIRHICGNELCVAQDHIEIGTILENHADKMIHGTGIKGEKNKMAKITEETASKIKKSRFDQGDPSYESQQKRADRFGVTRGLVNSIDRGMSWAHLEDRHGNTSTTNIRNMKNRERNKKAQALKWDEDKFRRAGEILYKKISKSQTSKKYDVEGECWNFTGATQNNYGVTNVLGKRKHAHVMSCEIKEKRHIVRGERTRHLCGNPICIAPHHLAFGSSRENSLDSVKNGVKSAKLDEQKVRKIRDSTFSNSDLAKKFDVSTQTIRAARNGKSWTHIF